MGIEENKAVIRRLFEEFNKGNYDIIDECFADNFQITRPNGAVWDRERFKSFVVGIQKSIPDIQRTIGDMVAEGDNLAFNFTWKGTDTGGLANAPPTGKALNIKEVYFCRLENGKIVEYKQYGDTLAMLQQGGLLPSTQEIIQSYINSQKG